MSDRRRRRPSNDESDQPPVRRRRYNTRSAVREDAEEADRRASGRYRTSSFGHHGLERTNGRSGAARNERPSSRSSRSNADNRSRSADIRGPSTSGNTRRRNTQEAGRTTTDGHRRTDDVPRPRRMRAYAAMSTGGMSAYPRLRDDREDRRRERSGGSNVRAASNTENRDPHSARSSRSTTSVRPSSSEAVRQARSLVRLFRVRSPARTHRFAPPSNPRPSRGSNILSRGTRSRPDGFNPVVAIEDIFGLPSSSFGTRSTSRVAAATRSNDHIAYVSPIGRPSHSTITTNGNRVNIQVAFGTDDEDSDSNDSLIALDRGLSNLLSAPEGDSSDDVFYSDLERLETDSGDSVASASSIEPPRSLVSLSLNALHPSPTPSLSSADTENRDDDTEAEEDDDAFRIIHIPDLYTDSVTSGVIFMRNNVISVDLMRRMAELSDAVSHLRNRLQTHTDGFRGFTPPRSYNLEPTRRRVPESVDCQRAKLTDELNSGTCECVICTDAIRNSDQVWPCNNCFNIFHLPCIRRWAKTNRATEMDGAWICPVCRRPKFCTPNKLRYRCLCGRTKKPRSVPGVTPHCCGRQCKHHCGLLCHPGPCRMSEAETEAVARGASSSTQPAGEPTRSASV